MINFCDVSIENLDSGLEMRQRKRKKPTRYAPNEEKTDLSAKKTIPGSKLSSSKAIKKRIVKKDPEQEARLDAIGKLFELSRYDRNMRNPSQLVQVVMNGGYRMLCLATVAERALDEQPTISFVTSTKTQEKAPVKTIKLNRVNENTPLDTSVSDEAGASFLSIRCFYHSNGVKSYEGQTRNGNREGYGKEFHASGEVYYQGTFKNDQYHGEGTIFYPSGVILYQGEFANGKKDGQGKWYAMDGILVHQGRFQQGAFIG